MALSYPPLPSNKAPTSLTSELPPHSISLTAREIQLGVENSTLLYIHSQSVPTSSPQATNGSWYFFQPCKILYKSKIHKGCTLPCSLWTTKWMYTLLELIHKRCILSCSQYNNPSRCTFYLCYKGCTLQCVKTKNSQTVSPLNLCKGKKRYLRRLILWVLLFRGWRKNQKNSQAVSPLNSFGKREKEESKEFLGG